jgi:tetratricopeptide (TPR) repeat protein
MLGSLLRRVWRGAAPASIFRPEDVEAAIARRDSAALRRLLAMPEAPDDARMVRWLAIAAVLDGLDDEALGVLESGRRLGDAACLAELGSLASECGRPASAAGWWMRARSAAPQSRGLAFNIANAWLAAGDCAAAAAEAEAAGREAPGDIQVRLLAARIAERADDAVRAVEDYRGIVAAAPQLRDAWEGLGRASRDTGDFVTAEAAFARAGPDCRLDVGLARFHQRRYADAVAVLRELVAEQPGRADARVVLANALIADGDFAAGWPAYEARYDVPGPAWTARCGRPWDGAPLAGTLVVDCEQGFGDCIFAARFLALARARVTALVLRCQPPLKELFAASGLADTVVGRDEACPDSAAHSYLLSLPALLSIAAPHREAAYLRVPEQRAREWRERLRGDRPVIGLIWSGAPEASQNRYRRFDPRDLANRLAPRYRLVSFQKPGQGIAVCPPGVSDLAGHLDDFADTAAALLALDALISAETSTAHLGGAVGVKTFVPLPVTADWRWEIAGVPNPWYGSLQVFRPARHGDWNPVWDAIEACLPTAVGGAP